ncbi:MAG TPA: lytic transglycosylase domain-containing protein [Thermoanaerobaculia bacterium]|nr:lytic transglycosylase domain-containing protein [Thermoanaerobaculia bacterium]
MRSIVRASGLLAVGFGLISLSLEGEILRRKSSPGSSREAPVAAVPSDPGPSQWWAEPLDPVYQQAAEAVRGRRCTEARETLEPLAREEGSRGRFARLVSGLHAHACEDVALAERRLAEAGLPGAPLEDWRLYLLAQSAHARHDEPAARDALAELLADYRDSPLWERALVAAVEQRAEAGDADQALELVRWSREQEGLAPATIARAEALAWKISAQRGDLAEQARTARRLLTYTPITASELGVVELFRRPSGDVAWRAILTGPELESRAAALLDAGLAAGAIDTLNDVPRHERSFTWSLLGARALVEEGRARQALEVLGRAAPADAAERAEVEWAEAQAYADLAAPLGAGAALSPDERARMRRASQEHLVRLVRQGGDRDLSRRALRQLFSEHVADNRFEPAVEALRRLRRLDPDDATGAGYLWGLGWQDYRRENYTGAVGYWSELVSTYPDTREARSGRYWSARAFEHLGERGRALEVFREIAASDTTDFYRRHAVARAAPGGSGAAAPPAAAEPPAEQPWPVDEALARARLLSDLGLDTLALAELEAQGERPDLRARNALTGLALARQGKYRAGIPYLRRAFPALGGPYQASVPAEARRLYYPLAFEETIRAAAERSRVPPQLVYGIIREESAFDITALSRVGARGLMQIMPATGSEVARKLGLGYSEAKLDDPGFNVRLGSAYFGQLLDMFDGRTELALAGYNGGPYRMKRLWREAGPRAELDYFLESLPIEESRNYVKRVLVFTDSYERLYGL